MDNNRIVNRCLVRSKNVVKIVMILMYKWEDWMISEMNTVDRIIYRAWNDSLLCKVRQKIGFCHLSNHNLRKDHLIICIIGQHCEVSFKKFSSKS
ncbi:hypothetical protein BpHYR1_017768 [Brachionus plicatilis]|uniref:Uncharacterized protein n=1 Tax=Brachionus plicatilis TaxID=10195 RepID=A0A3M7PQX8_BRAPC|nr:hypothetical protein BpHYR1_017768 [Brachionus plicatilis]